MNVANAEKAVCEYDGSSTRGSKLRGSDECFLTAIETRHFPPQVDVHWVSYTLCIFDLRTMTLGCGQLNLILTVLKCNIRLQTQCNDSWSHLSPPFTWPTRNITSLRYVVVASISFIHTMLQLRLLQNHSPAMALNNTIWQDWPPHIIHSFIVWTQDQGDRTTYLS